jgi:hypothetical protein
LTYTAGSHCPPGSVIIFTESLAHAANDWINPDHSRCAIFNCYKSLRAQEPTLPAQEPPYASVLAAVADGWRIVQFPDAKLYAYQGVDNDYLGFEFILEKMI